MVSIFRYMLMGRRPLFLARRFEFRSGLFPGGHEINDVRPDEQTEEDEDGPAEDQRVSVGFGVRFAVVLGDHRTRVFRTPFYVERVFGGRLAAGALPFGESINHGV